MKKEFNFTAVDKRCLGLELAKRRKLMKIRQIDVADAFGKTRNWLSLIESGTISISLIDAYHLCEMYNCDLSEVMRVAVETTKEIQGRS